MLKGARHALRQVDQAIAAARWTSGITSHALRLGYPSYAARAVHWVLSAFSERHPDMWVDEHQLQSQRIRAALLDRTLDVGFVNLPVGGVLATVPMVPDRLTILLPSTHELANRDRIPLARLADQPLLTADASSAPSYHAAVTACCQQAGFVPNMVTPDTHEPVTLEGLAHQVSHGRGLLLLLDGLPVPIPPEVVCRPADLPSASLRLTLAWREDNQSPSVRAFAALIKARLPITA